MRDEAPRDHLVLRVGCAAIASAFLWLQALAFTAIATNSTVTLEYGWGAGLAFAAMTWALHTLFFGKR